MKTLCTSIAIALAAVLQAAVVPTEWQVRVGPKATVFQAERYHGDALALRATLTSNGQPLPYQGTASLYAQTNGMGAAWWNLADATVSNNVLSATWLPEYDTGADVVDVFLGAPGSYQAHARIRFLPSPGATPGALPLPVPVLDFATVQVLNAPYLDAPAVTNAAEAAVVRFEESLKYGMDVGTGAVYGFAGDDYSSAYGLAWDGAWKYIRYGEGWATPGTELARMGDIPDLSHYATMEAATNAAAAVVARDAVTTSYGPGGGTFGWTGPHTIGGTSFDLFLPGGITIGGNTIHTAGSHALSLPEKNGTLAVAGDLAGATNATLNAAKAYTDGATNETLNAAKAYADGATNEISAQAASVFLPRSSGPLSLSYYPTYDELLFSKSNGDSLALGFGYLAWIVGGAPHALRLSDVATAGSIGAAVSNTVTTAFIRQKLGVYLYVGEDGGVYVHTDNQ